METYTVTINYMMIDPASPMFGVVRTTHRKYTDVSGHAAKITARSNFMGSRNPTKVKIVSLDIHDEQGRYAD